VLFHGVGFPELDLQSANGKLSTGSSRVFESVRMESMEGRKAALDELHILRRLSPINILPSIAFVTDMNMETSVNLTARHGLI
jgi:hypothetical protein